MRPSAILRGMLSYVPIVDLVLTKLRGGGGTASPSYCYSVWLRHLVMAQKSGLSTLPRTVAELGPGESVGVGLAALLTGSERYWALDVVSYRNPNLNLQILEGLVYLLRNRAPIPDGGEVAELQPDLDSYDFPATILSDHRLEAALSPDRLDRLRNAIIALGTRITRFGSGCSSSLRCGTARCSTPGVRWRSHRRHEHGGQPEGHCA